ncbi:hypothetical protein [Flavobacterium sp.]|uniref:hypothetical protein n=1 Tax=Flavobacterium sp. TaxID=239 RepID=UPI00374FE39C
MKTGNKLLMLLFFSFLLGCTTNSINDYVPQSTSFESETPGAPVGDKKQHFKVGDLISNIVVSGSNIKWYEKEYLTVTVVNNGKNNKQLYRLIPLNSSDYLINGKTYYATQTINKKESVNMLEVTIFLTFGSN